MLVISGEALSAMFAGSHSAYPNEFLGLLEGESKKNGNLYIRRLIIPSGFMVNSGAAYWNELALPPTIKVMGTFHSHPHAPSIQSRTDKLTGSKLGGAHIILGWPFSLSNLKAYDNEGKEIKFKIEK